MHENIRPETTISASTEPIIKTCEASDKTKYVDSNEKCCLKKSTITNMSFANNNFKVKSELTIPSLRNGSDNQ